MLSSTFCKTAVLALAALPQAIHAYQIDSSCGTNMAWLRNELNCAFGMVQTTLDLQTANIPTANRNAVNRLYTLLLGTQTPISGTDWVKGRFNGVWPSNAGAGYQDFKGILSMKNEVQKASKDDVVFYCDFSRFEYQTAKLRWYNKDLDEYVKKGTGNAAYPNPNDSCPPGTAAWTYASGDVSKPSEIQLCGWFLQWVAKNQFPTCASFGAKLEAWGMKAIQDKVFDKFKVTPVDLFSPLDKLLVHELTHTRPAGETDDVKMNVNGGSGPTNLAYGWTKCRTISSRTDLSNGPVKNADTFALIASGTRIINSGWTINDDGSLIDPNGNPSTTTPNRKRSRWLSQKFEA